jgi:hypothetical protein
MAILLFPGSCDGGKMKDLIPGGEEGHFTKSEAVRKRQPRCFGFNGDNDWECMALVGTKSTSRCTQLMDCSPVFCVNVLVLPDGFDSCHSCSLAFSFIRW